jgi:hypothetical protein
LETYTQRRKTPRSEYALETKWKGEQLIVNERYGPCGSYVKSVNAGFRTHSVNDPNLWGLPKMRKLEAREPW